MNSRHFISIPSFVSFFCLLSHQVSPCGFHDHISPTMCLVNRHSFAKCDPPHYKHGALWSVYLLHERLRFFQFLIAHIPAFDSFSKFHTVPGISDSRALHPTLNLGASSIRTALGHRVFVLLFPSYRCICGDWSSHIKTWIDCWLTHPIWNSRVPCFLLTLHNRPSPV